MCSVDVIFRSNASACVRALCHTQSVRNYKRSAQTTFMVRVLRLDWRRCVRLLLRLAIDLQAFTVVRAEM